MIDLGGWIWLIFRWMIYSTIYGLLSLVVLCIGGVWYRRNVDRRRVRNIDEPIMNLDIRSFVFHTLSFEILNDQTVNVRVQTSSLEKEFIDLGQLNGQKHRIRSIDLRPEQVEIHFQHSDIQLVIEHVEVDQKNLQSNRNYFVHEYTLTWTSSNYRSQFLDRINLINTGYWYGGATQRTVYWPINEFVTERQAMIPQDAYKNMFGNVCERYWLSSRGLALYIDPLVPLFVSMNKKHLELISEFRSPYQQETFVSHQFRYKLLQHVNMRDLHLTVINRYLGKPTSIPDQRMIAEPIWSTWAQFKQNINTEKILDYAEEIVQRNFPGSQLCIDDDWTPHYGDLEFDTKKFPNPNEMIRRLKDLNFRVTLWIHPFVSCRSMKFIHYWRRDFLISLNFFSSLIRLLQERFPEFEGILNDVIQNPHIRSVITFIQTIHKQYLPKLPGISIWWNGLAGVLDLTNDAVRTEYVSNLKRLQSIYGIDSFKFDAGEVNWLPIFGSFANPSSHLITDNHTERVTTPALYPYLYANLAHQVDSNNRLQEVRVGYRTQKLPIFVRIIDKDSNWSYNNGLRSLLPSIFNLGLLGYPFILPDMVGGNGYGLTIKRTQLPERELYIRWLQLNVLLPAIQFSFPPWIYKDEQVVRIAKKCLEIRGRFRSLLISTAEECVQYGTPMIRPLWFLDPYNLNSQTCDNEYLLGNDLLVAPVLDENVQMLNIYLPQGQWKCIHTARIYTGSRSHKFPVTIEDIPIFQRD